jgi:hypothetical protein
MLHMIQPKLLLEQVLIKTIWSRYQYITSFLNNSTLYITLHTSINRINFQLYVMFEHTEYDSRLDCELTVRDDDKRAREAWLCQADFGD